MSDCIRQKGKETNIFDVEEQSSSARQLARSMPCHRQRTFKERQREDVREEEDREPDLSFVEGNTVSVDLALSPRLRW